jgi:hypothetical protein
MRYARDVLPYRGTLVLFAVGVPLGARSHAPDSVVAVSSGEFAAEKTLKLAAETFRIGRFLAVLHQVQGRESTVRPSRTALPKLATCSLPVGG